jgi:hypothetical protein
METGAPKSTKSLDIFWLDSLMAHFFSSASFYIISNTFLERSECFVALPLSITSYTSLVSLEKK